MNNTIAATKAIPARKPRRTGAVLKKQLRDALKNKTVLVQFILFPLVAFVFTELVGKSMAGEDMPASMFATMFATMYAGMTPMAVSTAIISEEKENQTLNVLMMAGVKHWQYLLGTGIFVVGFCSLGALAFGLMSGHGGLTLLVFIGAMLLGILCSLILGFTVGMLAKNQMSANTLVMPISMVAAFLPLIAMFNESLAKISRFLYTQQLSTLLEGPADGINAEQLAVLLANFAVFLLLFIFAYRRYSRAK